MTNRIILYSFLMKTSKFLTVLVITFTLATALNTAQALSPTLFTDASSFAPWFASSVYEMGGNGVMTGYPDGQFKPTENVNRAELAVILDRFAEKVTAKKLDSQPYTCTMEFVYGLELQIIDQEGNPLQGVQVTSSQDEKGGSFSNGTEEGWYSGLGETAGQSDLILEKEDYRTHYDSVTIEEDGCHVDTQKKTIVMFKKSQ